MKRMTQTLLVALLAALFIGCTPTGGNEPGASERPTPTNDTPVVNPEVTDTPEFIGGVAPVEDVAILIMESWPLQAQVNVEGYLPDGCTTLADPTVTREGNTFLVQLPTHIKTGVACTDALEPYVTRIPLDILGLSAGTYTVDVNGTQNSFTLDQDNVAGQTEEPDDAKTITGEALVDSIAVNLMESFPLQMSVQVSGNLNDGCTTLAEPEIFIEGLTIDILLPTSRPADAMCTQALVPFDVTIPVDIVGLTAGTYTVEVNGVTSTFTLDQDNVSATTEDMYLSDADRAELVRLTLDMAINQRQMPDLQLLAEGETPVLSTALIDSQWLEGAGIDVVLMSPEAIQEKADADGDFLYLHFDQLIGTAEGEATVQISNTWAIATGSTTGYLSGGGFEVHFTRTADGWEGEIVSMWIS